MVHVAMGGALAVREFQVENFSQVLESPLAWVGLGLLVPLAAGTFAFPRLRWTVLGTCIWASTLGFAADQYFNNMTSAPLSKLILLGRPLTLGLILALLLPALLTDRGWRVNLVSAAAVSFFSIELAWAFREVIGAHMLRGVMSALTFVLMFLVMHLGVSKWLQNFKVADSSLRALALAGVLLIGGTVFELAIRPSSLVHQGRLYATTSNPNHAASALAYAFPPFCWLLGGAKGRRWLWRLVGAAGLVTASVLLAWTGSRGGALTTVVSMMVMLRRRLGVLVIAGALVASGLYVASHSYQASSQGAQHLTDTTNTRAKSWNALIHDFVSSPIYGTLSETENVGIAESSYLGIAARLGVIGLALLALTFIAWGTLAIRLIRARPALGENGFMADVVLGGLAGIAFEGIFEAFLMGTLMITPMFLFVYVALANFLLESAQSPPEPATEFEPVQSMELAYGYSY